MDEWRTILYPLGFLSIILFGLRFLVQWWQSEKARRSVASELFWHLSLAGNLMLFVHSFIQFQVHICLIQACNAVISWRNLNMMQKKKPPVSLKTMIYLMIAAILFTLLGFKAQEIFLNQSSIWFRIPTAPWQTESRQSIPMFWHILGGLAYCLFSIRFWLQWWATEVSQTSLFPKSFWWLSLIGALFSIIYFYHIHDSVNLIGPLLGIIPYVRNIILMQKSKMSSQNG